MRPPFPGMDPWLEQPAIWPDVHNRLIAAIADELAPRLAPRFYVSLEERTYLVLAEDREPVARPDLSVVETGMPRPPGDGPRGAGAAVAEAVADEVMVERVAIGELATEWYLYVRQAGNNRLVTVIEVLSPANKSTRSGRRQYLRKRQGVLRSLTNLVEIDLLRGGRPMPTEPLGEPIVSDYRILVARGEDRPEALSYRFGLRKPIPAVPIPLLPGDDEPLLALGPILHALYDRARFDLRLDYKQPPTPPLSPDDAAWARDILGAAR